MGSHITGQGYGESHNWKWDGQGASRVTHYRCAACGERFAHWYDQQPNIFEAIKTSGVVDTCPEHEKEGERA